MIMKNLNKLISLVLLLTISFNLFGQTGVSINTDNSQPNESAILDVKTTTQGVLLPRMTVNQRLEIVNPAEELLVYQTNDVEGYYFYNGSNWQYLVTNSQITNFGSGQIITTEERTKLQNDNDQSQTNEIQDLQITGSTLKITNNTSATNIDLSFLSVPVGTILPFAGESNTVPEGWLLCDGTELNAVTYTQYQDLYNVIGNNLGGTANYNFKVPDLRGQFLRGADLETGINPDFAARTGGSLTEKIGSVQPDAFQGHRHTPLGSTGNFWGESGNINGGSEKYGNGACDNTTGSPSPDGVNGTPRTTSETRP